MSCRWSYRSFPRAQPLHSGHKRHGRPKTQGISLAPRRGHDQVPQMRFNVVPKRTYFRHILARHSRLLIWLDLMICTTYKSISLLIYATIAPNDKVFGTIGCNANHINAACNRRPRREATRVPNCEAVGPSGSRAGYASQNGSLMIHFSPPRASTNSPIVALDPGSLRWHGNTRLVARQFDEPKG